MKCNAATRCTGPTFVWGGSISEHVGDARGAPAPAPAPRRRAINVRRGQLREHCDSVCRAPPSRVGRDSGAGARAHAWMHSLGPHAARGQGGQAGQQQQRPLEGISSTPRQNESIPSSRPYPALTLPRARAPTRANPAPASALTKGRPPVRRRIKLPVPRCRRRSPHDDSTSSR